MCCDDDAFIFRSVSRSRAFVHRPCDHDYVRHTYVANQSWNKMSAGGGGGLILGGLSALLSLSPLLFSSVFFRLFSSVSSVHVGSESATYSSSTYSLRVLAWIGKIEQVELINQSILVLSLGTKFKVFAGRTRTKRFWLSGSIFIATHRAALS
jgi:hypothetical protein